MTEPLKSPLERVAAAPLRLITQIGGGDLIDRLGLRAAMVSRVGDEQMGRFLTDTLAREGCDGGGSTMRGGGERGPGAGRSLPSRDERVPRTDRGDDRAGCGHRAHRSVVPAA